ncbi:UV DNA damage repair endonuclease UvsE [Halobacillus shinanisalinarum]|uniref:UV DNA damage endonuclease n=1 Tax=Halobacillus shinanisalinarum TaxID=2932258 RepID=A0ABY4GTX9_9BACI|nr:UV DNA damage repair endonuclease UvsE [Halobacillus shinanisalinarum]UOQ91617.1 UV DNA damage repair endonuclease UvsE [Halobacillus shinanisalinarum]
MIIRFGYVAMATSLYDASPSKTMTFSRYKQLGKKERIKQLKEITRANLEHTIRALHYNIAHEIHLYRFSSSLVPLATHEEVEWDYLTPFQKEYEKIGELVKEHQMRTSFHPNQFTLFTSEKEHVTTNTVKDMEYHYSLLEAMGLEKESHINLHVGGAYGDKPSAMERFHANLKQLPIPIKKQMTLENDDKTYTTTETLSICEKESIPMMFDYHHYMANHEEEEKKLEDLLLRFYQTWSNNPFPPKIHASSPRSEKAYRSHADFVDIEFIKPLIKVLKSHQVDVDFMIEAKKKDKAVLQLVEDVAKIRGAKRIDGATIKI